jgi:hypothetical protein
MRCRPDDRRRVIILSRQPAKKVQSERLWSESIIPEPNRKRWIRGAIKVSRVFSYKYSSSSSLMYLPVLTYPTFRFVLLVLLLFSL